MTNIVAACVVLYNICEFHGDRWPTETANRLHSQITPHSSTAIADSVRKMRERLLGEKRHDGKIREGVEEVG